MLTRCVVCDQRIELCPTLGLFGTWMGDTLWTAWYITKHTN